jgi:Zn-dependent protease with chaperone function
MKKIFIFLGLCLVLGLQAAKNPNRPLAAPNRPLSSFGYCMRDVSDFIMWESYGFHAISEANQLYINGIIHELGMDDYCIEMRGMSNAAQFAVGRINAFVVPSLFSDKKSHAFLFISEEWFDSLTELEKQALVRHELMHLKCNHGRKKFTLGMVNLAFLCLMQYLLIPKDIQEASVVKKTVGFGGFYVSALGVALVNAKYSRMCEKEADLEAAKSMHNKQGFIDLFNNFKDHTEDPESRFAFKRFVAHVFEFICTPLTKFNELFATHPSLDERIAYISELK